MPARLSPGSIPLALLLAGCLAQPLAPGTGVPPPAGSVDAVRVPAPDFDFSSAIVADHLVPGGHAVRAIHTGSHGLELVGYSPLTERKHPAATAGGWAAMGVWRNHACVAQLAGTGGVAIVDVSNPATPTVTAHVNDGMLNADCQFTDDGEYLFTGAFLGQLPAHEGLRALPVPGPADAFAAGVAVYDTKDKSNPKLLLFSETGTYHNLFVRTIHGTHYLVQAFSGNVYRLVTDGEPRLEHVATQQPMVHDMWISKHPITGKWILYTGSEAGFVMYGFDDPAKPELLGQWEPEDGAKGWHRQTPIDQLVDGRAIVIVGGERGDGATEPYAVVDVTDVAEPRTLSTWDVPGSPESPQPNFFTFSPHELTTWNGYVAVANYHAGVWLLDVGSPERLRAPATLGYYLPHEEPAAHGGVESPPFAFQPYVWGAYFDERGYVLAADWSSGLYVLKFAGTKG